MNADVFIGYARKDSEAAEKIQAYLSAAGFRCYRDQTDILSSEDWLAAIANAIDDCQVFLFVASEASVYSDHAVNELLYAHDNKKAIVPLFLSRAVRPQKSVKLLLASLQWTFADPSLDSALPAVADAVARKVDESKHRDAYEDEKDILRRANYDLQTDFRDNISGLGTGKLDGGTADVQDGAYTMMAEPGRYLGQHLHLIPALSEFVVDVKISKASGPKDEGFGLEFGDGWPGNYYQFLLSGSGAVRVSKHLKKKWSDVFQRPGLRQVLTADSTNVLKVIRKDEAIHLFVNGLHAATCSDFDIRAGEIGFVVGKGMHVGFSGLTVHGIGLDSVFVAAIEHWMKLEMREAKELLRYIVRYAPSYKHPDYASEAIQLIREVRTDYRETVLIAIGYAVMPQVNEGIPAAKLRDEINKRGRPHEFRFASIVTDAGLLEEDSYMKCPVISIGGPAVNKVTEALANDLPDAVESTERMHIQCDIEKRGRRVALWGRGPSDTAGAVEAFIAAGHLDRFLDSIWRT